VLTYASISHAFLSDAGEIAAAMRPPLFPAAKLKTNQSSDILFFKALHFQKED
jgi:hypothetical protein